jgi:hypothetical protein
VGEDDAGSERLHLDRSGHQPVAGQRLREDDRVARLDPGPAAHAVAKIVTNSASSVKSAPRAPASGSNCSSRGADRVPVTALRSSGRLRR